MISANLIVKNEEETIEKCLTQVSKIADEILIIDTGSEDKTLEIIKKFPVKLLEKKGEIRDLRNELLQKSKGDWILTIDGDEVWEDKELEKLKKLPEKYPESIAFGFTFNHYLSPDIFNDKHKSKSIRLFKKTLELRWVGKFPNELLCDENGLITTTNNPRRDIKFISYLKFNHYGGIKKYQWRAKQPEKFGHI